MDMSEAKVTPELIRAALTTVKYPGFSRDIVSFGLVKNIEVSAEGAVRIELRIESKNEDVPRFVYQSVMTEVNTTTPMWRNPLALTMTPPSGRPRCRA